MPRRFVLKLGGWPVFPLLVFLGCRPAPGPLVPANATPLTIGQVTPWVTRTLPSGSTIRQFKWLFQDDRSSAGGDGRARLAAPDTLRFDARGPLGSGRMAAMVVGDRPVWAEPKETVDQIVPDYALFWAMFGVALMPGPRASIRGLDDSGRQIWEYSLGGDTLVYVRTTQSPGKFVAEVRRSGRLFGRVETRLGEGGQPVSARLIVPDVPARLDITFQSTTAQSSFPPETWIAPEP